MIKTLLWKKDYIEIIDQSRLPHQLKFIKCYSEKDIYNALKEMKIRGAPAIGVFVAFGVVLKAKRIKSYQRNKFIKDIKSTIAYFKTARPTAVNLFWALERMERLLNADKTPQELITLLEKEALAIYHEDRKMCEGIGRNGAELIEDGDEILTHCNAGALATAGMGTALAVLYYAKKQGKKFHVWIDETRPVLQGARLTAWELREAKIPATLICDNTAGYLMKLGRIKKIIVGADRITRKGDFANKIGTYSLAVLARAHGIPFYVAAPSSSFDFKIKAGREIAVEERERDELIYINNKAIAPPDIAVFNPAFDIIEAKYVTAFITEKGIFFPPFSKTLRELKDERR